MATIRHFQLDIHMGFQIIRIIAPKIVTITAPLTAPIVVPITNLNRANLNRANLNLNPDINLNLNHVPSLYHLNQLVPIVSR